MAKCSLCGCPLKEDMTFCPNCHSEIIAISTAKSEPTPKKEKRTPKFSSHAPHGVYQNADYNQLRDADYALILLSKGRCSKEISYDILEDFLSYDASSSEKILSLLPCKIAHTLTHDQAAYLSQALTEYGMQIQVINQNTSQPIDLPACLNMSMFDNCGHLIPVVLPLLSSLSSENLPDVFERYALPYAPRPFTLRFKSKQPVCHIRRSIHS